MIGHEQALPGEGLPRHDAEREDVRATIDVLGAQLLWRAIRELPLDLSGVGLRGTKERPRDAEVGDARASVDADEDVLRRDVAVDDLEGLAHGSDGVVSGVESLRGLSDELDAHGDRHRPPHLGGLLDDAAEGDAHHQLHRDVESTLRVPTEVERLHHVGTRDVRGEPRFIEEHGDEIFVLGERRQHPLDRDELLEARFAGRARRIHLGHASRRDAEEHFVASHGPRRTVDPESTRHGRQTSRPPRILAFRGRRRLRATAEADSSSG